MPTAECRSPWYLFWRDPHTWRDLGGPIPAGHVRYRGDTARQCTTCGYAGSVYPTRDY